MLLRRCGETLHNGQASERPVSKLMEMLEHDAGTEVDGSRASPRRFFLFDAAWRWTQVRSCRIRTSQDDARARLRLRRHYIIPGFGVVRSRVWEPLVVIAYRVVLSVASSNAKNSDEERS